MKTAFTFVVALLVNDCANATTPVKPEFIAMTPAIFTQLGFRVGFAKSDGTGKKFAFYYPEEIEARAGQTVRVAVKGPGGGIESESINSIGKSQGYVQLSFDSKHDVEVSIEYRCGLESPKWCQGEREYGISSVASFIGSNH